jgi:hypothetical protein
MKVVLDDLANGGLAWSSLLRKPLS